MPTLAQLLLAESQADDDSNVQKNNAHLPITHWIQSAQALEGDAQLPPNILTQKKCCKNDCLAALCLSPQHVGLCREIYSELSPLAAAANEGRSSGAVPVPTKSALRSGQKVSLDTKTAATTTKRRMKVVDITGHRLSTRKDTYMAALTPRLRQLADLRVFKGSEHGGGDAQGPCL
jgi:hypothetical protein